MEGPSSFTKPEKVRLEQLAQKYGITLEEAANLAAAAGVEIFFRDPAETVPAKIIVLNPGGRDEPH